MHLSSCSLFRARPSRQLCTLNKLLPCQEEEGLQEAQAILSRAVPSDGLIIHSYIIGSEQWVPDCKMI